MITGNTGFKGSWLSLYLQSLGANVYGYSKSTLSDDSIFLSSGLNELIETKYGDIRDFSEICSYISKIKPNFLFHLAAQPLVRTSYASPLETFETNTLGTANVMESLRLLADECVGVIITSDKSYRNVEWLWGYRENDTLGGADPYSGSKSAAEMVIDSYVKSYFTESESIKIAIARAGNVIGGGDWSSDRIVPDAYRAWYNLDSLVLRNPSATRPWQHVLEPIRGYVELAAKLYDGSISTGEAFNFGPESSDCVSVGEIVSELSKTWHANLAKIEINSKANNMKESGLLRLNCDKSLDMLGWKSALDYRKSVEMTASWYEFYYNNRNKKEIFNFTELQMKKYLKEIVE